MLTKRQRAVYTLICQGHTQAEIAAMLGIALKTVEAHTHRIRVELGVPPRHPLSSWLLARGTA